MKYKKDNFYIFTGAPGVGKTTLLKALKEQGMSYIAEPAREILAEQRLIGGKGVSEQDQKVFRDLILTRSIDKFIANIHIKDTLLFDRGIPDVASYSHAFGFPQDTDVKTAQEYGYNNKVFILPPWEEIYSTDEERTMKFEQLQEFHDSLVKTYQELNYELLEVPKASITDRCNFIKENI